MTKGHIAAIIAALVVSWASPVASAPRICAVSSADQEQVSRTVHSFYAALTKDDEAGFSAITAPTFYAYEVGRRLNGPELSATIRKAHGSGRIYEWNLGPIEVHGNCDVIWATWENHGRVGDSTGMRPVMWLESAALHRDGSRWVLDFLHSTPVGSAK
ncbi:hypothetical protein [Caulobacter sp. BE254]|uniref:hypothetical protein n=1 Tax=Caulobacter sp. BE254 TaxID=2817720 RepID=UPI0028614CB6|nr:hypothetical protein [Caulobacter sp. BE254]MDR7116931.1 hypothetical protein [Caulobacter sp. BE254]